MKILITGANGMLGQDLSPILEDEDFVDEIVETDIDNLDITNEVQVNKVLKDENPDVVIHCAGYTNVDDAEVNKDLAEKINVKGTENIVKACKKNDIILVFISTDYVFDGNKKTKYLPIDATNPLNFYGLTKMKAEQIVQMYLKKYYIVRTSWLYGIHGKNFVETMINLAKQKKSLNVVNDQIGCPTWTVELSEAIADLLAEMPEFGIYHICGSGQTSWYDFAKEIFNLTDLAVDLKPCTTEEYKTKAIRPKFSVMENDGICENWKTSLKSYLELRVED
ncbi:MAG: dTDP-4-dehydrorhamnose reductase [Candidatus Gastranaerophilaceae bacterium]